MTTTSDAQAPSPATLRGAFPEIRTQLQQMSEVNEALVLFNKLLDAAHTETVSADHVRSMLVPLQSKLEAAIEDVRDSI